MTLNKGDDFAGYEIKTRIGSGGMATVYQAYHDRLDRHVAIKVLHESFVRDDTFLERFEREARIIARLEHPQIVPIYDYAEFDGQPYIVMKYIKGGTLKRLAIKEGIALDDMVRMMSMLADGLTYAHETGVLHRDIKPSNILIDERNLPYISDFGLARIAQFGDSTISHDMMLGTPFYISPEQARGERDLTPATDVYAFAVILYELLTGQVPFGGDTAYAIVHEQIYTPPTPPSQINTELTPALDDVLLKALAKEPSQRYQTATDLMRDLKLALAESGVTRLPPLHVASFGGGRAQRSAFDFEAKDYGLGDLGQKIDQSIRKGVEFASEIADQFDKKKKKPPPSPEVLIRQRVEKKLKARSEFLQHLTVFLAINGICWLIWIFSRGGFPWPIFVTATWGIGLVNQYVDYYYKHGRGADRGEEEIESEITRQMRVSQWHDADRRKGGYEDEEALLDADDAEARAVRLNDDGELSDSFVDEMEGGRADSSERQR
ncbi:MAG: protein kinase [Chloroflexi bacterium]|nr:protein kinase [Chloroflexota bacterium]